MNKTTGNKELVLKLLENTARNLSVSSKKTLTAKGAKAKTTATTTERDQIVEQFNRAYERARIAPSSPAKKSKKKSKAKAAFSPTATVVEDVWYSPRDRTIALFQSAMDEYLRKQKSKTQKAKAKGLKKATEEDDLDSFYKPKLKKISPKKGSKTVSAKALAGEKFDILDPGWIKVVWEKAKLAFKGKHKFITHKKLTDFHYALAPNAKIALISDWGGGNDHAKAVSDQVKLQKPDIVIHLGDVYYAGTEDEVKERLLKHWPLTIKTGNSFALNSNHEMYSGGYAYFDITLKKFGQGASYFCLGNDNVRLICLDTGYIDHDLNQEQMEWLDALLNDGSNAKNFLLSHHQPFSAYESAGKGEERLQNWLDVHLTTGRINSWFWGHEHLLVLYKKFLGVKGRCIGNGCFPYSMPSSTPPFNSPQDPKVEWINTRPDPKRQERGIHSFALMTLNGTSSVKVEYIDEDGVVSRSETL